MGTLLMSGGLPPFGPCGGAAAASMGLPGVTPPPPLPLVLALLRVGVAGWDVGVVLPSRLLRPNILFLPDFSLSPIPMAALRGAPEDFRKHNWVVVLSRSGQISGAPSP